MDLPDGDLLMPRQLNMRLISADEIRIRPDDALRVGTRAGNDPFFVKSQCRQTLNGLLQQPLPVLLDNVSTSLSLRQNTPAGTIWTSQPTDSGLSIQRNFNGFFGVQRSFDAFPQITGQLRFNQLCQISSGISSQYTTQNDIWVPCGSIPCRDFHSQATNRGAALFDIYEDFNPIINRTFPQTSFLTPVGDLQIDTTRNQNKTFVDNWVHVDGIQDVFLSHTWRPFKLTMGLIGYKYSPLHSINSTQTTDTYSPCVYYMLWEITG
jgi:hypothetical protein